jgi:undecaprenyl-diphosphatase
MSDYWTALITGIVEGLTEFLPVSSTAHIVLTQKLLNIDLTSSFWKMFTVVIQLGAILAVVVYFRKRLTAFVLSFPWPKGRSSQWSDARPSEPISSIWKHPLTLVVLSFVVTAIPCFLMDKFIADQLESPLAIALALFIGGIVMVIVDRVCSPRAKTTRMEDMTLTQAIVIGLTQILAATFPGTSRSMATIAGGQVMGLSRPAALEFSFFLSIPVMFAAAGFKLLQFIVKEPVTIETNQWITLAIGFITSFVVALGVIAWFMQWVKSRGFVPFAIYRILLGITVLVWLSR